MSNTSLVLTDGHLGALHPFQVEILELVAQNPGLNRGEVLVRVREGNSLRQTLSFARMERYLDALERQAWLVAEEKIIRTATGGFKKMKHYALRDRGDRPS